MIPERAEYIRQMLPQVDAFLSSDMEVRSLFGDGVDLWEAAETAKMGLVSASIVIEGYGALFALGRGKNEAWARLTEIED